MKRSYKIQISEPAVGDIQDLFDRVQPHAWSWAERSLSRVLRDLADMQKFPRIGAPCLQFDGLRSRVSGPFRIYYEVDDENGVIKIYRFWSTLRDNPSWDDLLD
jgi:plasmid stabilization system protein ParE